MSMMEELNEKLREACCMGDNESVYRCLTQGADVNSKNKMNGWTCLHWAAKRGHTNLVEVLLRSNADPNVLNDKQQTPLEVADLDLVKDILKDKSNVGSSFKPVQAGENDTTGVKFVPNYLAHPVFPYGANQQQRTVYPPAAFQPSVTTVTTASQSQVISGNNSEDDELVLRVRYPKSNEMDFIEIELDTNELTYDNLVKTCTNEFKIDPALEICKIRKLPNIIVRKDKDMKRLEPFQELEIFTGKRKYVDDFQ